MGETVPKRPLVNSWEEIHDTIAQIPQPAARRFHRRARRSRYGAGGRYGQARPGRRVVGSGCPGGHQLA
ncbi:hypothetical protein CHELA40_13018 [Chelatococcus asaccharovorans]|nr:hypothetical protein CHELA40_13018 [Chelatococcus asaccharovorans]